MSTFINTIRNLATYVSTHEYNTAIDNVTKQLKDFLANYPAIALQDISAINNIEELKQIKEIINILKENLGFVVPDSIHTAIDNRIQAITTIPQLGRNFQELLSTERELSKRAGGVAVLLIKYQIQLSAIAKDANFIPKAIEAYKVLQDTDKEFSCLEKIDLNSLKGLCDFVEKLRFDIGQSENFGRRIAAILDITLSYSKIDYLINTLLQDQSVLNSMSRDECKQLEAWPIAPMQRLPRLMIFPKEINELIDKLSSNPTVIAEQANAVKEMKERINYFFKEKISKHTLRLNQAKKAIDFKLQLQQENSSYLLSSLSKLYYGTVIQWETEQAPELKPVVDSVKRSMTGSANLGNATHRPISRMLAMPSKPSSRMTESAIPIFDNYCERLDRIAEPLLAIQQRSITSSRRQITSTLKGEELRQFYTMVTAIQKRQAILSGKPLSVTVSTIESTNKPAKRKAIVSPTQAANTKETGRAKEVIDRSVPEPLAKKAAAHRAADLSAQQECEERTTQAKEAGEEHTHSNTTEENIAPASPDINTAIDLLNAYCKKLITIDPSIVEITQENNRNDNIYNKYLAANEMISALIELLINKLKTDNVSISTEVYDLIKFITDDMDTAKTKDEKLKKIMQFEKKFCPIKGPDLALAAFKTFLIAAVGFVLGAVIASSAVIIAAAATGVAPPLTIAGITACLTTGWSIYVAAGGAALGTIVGATIGIKSFFFSETPQQHFVKAASSFVNNADPEPPKFSC